jgi:hypothetical protein
MLKLNQSFQQLPIHLQEVYARLSEAFSNTTDNLFKSPEDLAEATQVGNRNQWETFLNFEPTQAFIKQQMTSITQIAQRRAFLALQVQAQSGNVQAVKEINELSGIMSRSDDNRTIVLHQIARPTILPQGGTQNAISTTDPADHPDSN